MVWGESFVTLLPCGSEDVILFMPDTPPAASLLFSVMPLFKIYIKRSLYAVLLYSTALVATIYSQQDQKPTRPEPADEVIRITSDLVQTDVMVFDQQGRFVDKLRPEQFELRVDGKPQAISFFERVAAGTVNEEAQLAAARGGARVQPGKNPAAVRPLDRGRTIFFFADDLHLSASSINRTRKMLLRFINDEIGQNDEAAVFSASGQIGFLQQLTKDKVVLRAAVNRLGYHPYDVRTSERPPMTEYQALAIDRNGRDVIDYFVGELLKERLGMMPNMARGNSGIGSEMALEMVKGRASQILQRASAVTTNILLSLESLIRSSASLPGRKIVFFISDGFFIDTRNSDSRDRLRRITDAAARAGVLIYTMDARGLSTDSMFDASSEAAFDPSGRLARLNSSELSASQEPLYTLASETGGRALLNTNALDAALTKSLKESSIYYLLAWRPEGVEQRGGKFRRIEVSVKGHPDFSVRVRRGFFDVPQSEPSKRATDTIRRDGVKTPEDELRAAIRAIYPSSALPTDLSLNYIDTPKAGILLLASMRIPSTALAYEAVGGRQKAAADVAGVVLNDKGKQVVGFKDRLDVIAASKDSIALEQPGIIYTYQANLSPGLYQVRIAARDTKSGRTGSATAWVEIPDLTSRHLALSSLLVGERAMDPAGMKAETNVIPQVNLSVDRRFARTSRLRLTTFIYNASRGAKGDAPPDVAIQIQIFRDDQPVFTNALSKVVTEGALDLERLPYAAEISLDSLPAGRYVLQVTAIDRAAKTSAAQRVDFEVE